MKSKATIQENEIKSNDAGNKIEIEMRRNRKQEMKSKEKEK